MESEGLAGTTGKASAKTIIIINNAVILLLRGFMDAEIKIDSCYRSSKDVVVREVMGKMLIIPLTSGIGDMEDEIYTLNETGMVIWDMLSRGDSVRAVIEAITGQFEADAGEIEKDVKGLMKELLKRRILEEIINA
jgi:hypothetical protein